MISVIKSSYAQRIMRCGDVFSDSRIKEPHLHKLVNDFTLLAEKLIELCNKPITGNSSVSTLCTELTLHSIIIINQLNNLSGTSSRLQQLFMRSVYDIVNHSPKLIPKIYYFQCYFGLVVLVIRFFLRKIYGCRKKKCAYQKILYLDIARTIIAFFFTAIDVTVNYFG